MRPSRAWRGFEGEIRWQSNKPDGQPRRQLDVTRAAEKFGFRATTLLEEGLRKTIDWYEKSLESGVASRELRPTSAP